MVAGCSHASISCAAPVLTRAMSAPLGATYFIHHRHTHRHGVAHLGQLKRECLATPLRRPNRQSAVDGQMCFDPRAFAQAQSTNNFRRNPEDQAVAPLHYLQVHDANPVSYPHTTHGKLKAEHAHVASPSKSATRKTTCWTEWLFGQRPRAPLLLTRYAVMVTIHPRPRAILQEELGFLAGVHLRAVLAAVALERGDRCGIGCGERHG